MKKIFTLAAAILASFSFTWAATVDDLVTISADHNIYFEGMVSANVSAGTLLDEGYLLSPKGNTYNGSKGTDEVINKKYCLRVKNATQDLLVFKVSSASTLVLYADRITDRTPVLNTSASTTDAITGEVTVEKEGQKYGYATYSIPAAGTYYIIGNGDCFLAGLEFSGFCTNPEFTVSPTEGTGFVGDPIDITVSSKNQSKPINSAVTLDGVAAVYGTDYTFSATTGLVQATPLKAGKFEITFSQASNGTYCDAKESATFVISEKTPVASVTIDGPAAGVIGQELTYTATAEGATAYQWLVDGVKQGSDSAKLIYTAVKGDHSIVCKARNEFNAEDAWIASDPINLTVTKLCGELIKATHTAGKTADVTGVVGGTADKNTANDGKFGGKGQYFGITLANGTFMVGDEINVHTTTAAGQGTLAFYADKNGSTLIYDTESAGVAGDNQVVLTNAFAGKSTIYVCRTEGNTWNGYVDYISVTRSCEDSNDASVSSLTVNGETVAKDAEANKFEYTVSAAYVEENVTVAFTIHPLATSDKENNTFTIPTPAAGDINGASFKVTAEDGTQVTYTVFISKSASLSNDATLKALSVEGFELTPAFDPAVTAYTITKAYSAELPAVGLVTATTNDANATANAAYNELVANEILVQVLAEDEETANTYSITVLSAAAKKDLLEASFSNGANGYILGGNIRVPYLYGTAEPVFVAAKFWKADGEPSAEIVDGQLVVTGIDEAVEKYTIEYVAVTPMEASYDLITFTEVPSYIFSVYGWADDKGVKISKDVEEAAQKRISEGRDRIYIALPAAESVILTGGSTGARPIKVTVNGVVDEKVKSTPKNGETVTIELSQSSANFVGIESNGNSGDAGFTKMQLVKGTSTALDNTEAEVKAVKVVRDGQLLIMKNGVLYNAQGAIVK